MFVIEVIPLVRGVQIESLTYFGSQEYPRGALVSIPLRGKTVQGIVVLCEVVSSAKTALKAATFSLRKLPPQPTVRPVSPLFIQLVDVLYTIYPAHRGALLMHLLPPDVRSGTVTYPMAGTGIAHEDSSPQLVTGPFVERQHIYQSITRTSFAHRGSVLVVAPTAATAIKLYESLRHGVEDRTVLLHSEQSKKQRTENYTRFTDTAHAVVVIATPHFAYLDRADFTTIIIEEAGSAYYTERTRPYIDHRVALRTLARLGKRQCIFGDICQRSDEYALLAEETAIAYGDAPQRLTLATPLSIIEQHDKPTPEIPFALFAPETLKRIKTALDGKKNVFIYAARRGLAPVVACVDCGHIFRCPNSGVPYSLLRTTHPTRGEERWFISTTSGTRTRAADVCPQCGSWRLRERGIGIQFIEDELKTLFPHVPRIVIDSEHGSTQKKLRTLAQSFAFSSGTIGLGTTVALPYLTDSVALSVIPSLDAVRSIPTWRADEALFRLLLRLREQSSEEVVVQTRTAVDDLLLYAGRGAIDRFHTEELRLRQELSYPPFSTFYMLTWQGDQQFVETTETLVKTHLLGTVGEFYNNPQSPHPTIIRHCLIRITPPIAQPLIDSLRHLPPYITIMVNPDRIV